MNANLLDSVLAIDDGPRSVNFYRDTSDIGGLFATSARQRRQSLLDHLASVSGGDVVLVGEAAGWMGARQSGVAFTSAPDVGLSGDREASAAVVRRGLAEHNLLDRALLWNAFPLHPHDTGDRRTNRTPLVNELRRGRAALSLAIRGRRIICVGEKAAFSVGELLSRKIPKVGDAPDAQAVVIRHPAYGGGPRFLEGLRLAMR